MGHYRSECKHGVLMGQCRCPSQDKEVRLVDCPPSCPPAASDPTLVDLTGMGQSEMSGHVDNLDEEIRTLRTRVAELDRALDEQIKWGDRLPYHHTDRVAGVLATLDETTARIAKLEKTRCHHGWRGRVPEKFEAIVTPCPSCGVKSLFVGPGGHLTCAISTCADQDAEKVWAEFFERLVIAEAALETGLRQTPVICRATARFWNKRAEVLEAEKGQD